MRTGASIALIVLGAILAFAVRDAFEGVDLTTIGYILMGAGTIGLLLGLYLDNKKSTTTSTTREQAVGAGPGYGAGPAVGGSGTGERVVNSQITSDGPPRY